MREEKEIHRIVGDINATVRSTSVWWAHEGSTFLLEPQGAAQE
jgi:hypothetical protein